jgi:ketosteroid isomerase-like protein
MKMSRAFRAALALTSLFVLPTSPAGAQSRGVPPEDDLFRTIADLDTALFAAYNACELAKFETYFAEDVEFYHDQGGLTRGRQALTAALKENICGKVRREIVPGALQVHLMKGYGALQTGVHRFHQPKSGPEAVGEAQFIHLWQNQDGAWRITRVISYDHRPLK